MINAIDNEKAVSESSKQRLGNVTLPSFNRLAINAIWSCVPLIGIFAFARQPYLAISVAIGVSISIFVCGLLHLIVSKLIEPQSLLGADVRSKSNAGIKFYIALPLKFIVTALLTWLLLSIPGLNLLAVVIGVAIAQTAVVITAARSNSERSREVR